MLRHVGLSPSVESRPGYQFFESVVDFFVPAADNGGGCYIGAAGAPNKNFVPVRICPYQSVQSAANTTPATGEVYLYHALRQAEQFLGTKKQLK